MHWRCLAPAAAGAAGAAASGRLRQPAKAEVATAAVHGQVWPPPKLRRQRFTVEGAARCMSKTAPRALQAPVRHDCGDDAFFLTTNKKETISMGMADGVSSWSRYGINPALFAWDLMVHCEAACEAGASDPEEILANGFEATLRDGAQRLIGSSTACIVALNSSTGQMEIANLGDSGALVVQPDGTVILETKEQQHYFNCPYQLVCIPQSKRTGLNGGDLPASSDKYHTEVRVGDLLILATDGFFDNIFKETAVKVVTSMAGSSSAEIAEHLVDMAYKAAMSHEDGPFSRNALEHGMRHRGGKPDDITVLVARIKAVE